MKKMAYMIVICITLFLSFSTSNKADITDKRKGLIMCVTPESTYWACMEDQNETACGGVRNCD